VAVLLASTETPVAGQVTVRPDGEEVPTSVIAPAKLNVLFRPTVRETPDWPTLMFVGATCEMKKSPTCTVNETDWVTVPGEPVLWMLTA
jgi:hypothetical protein